MAENSTIQVRFIDADTGATIGETEQQAEDLPESFEAAATLNIGERTFEVVSATPMTAREFRATGTLRLELREVRVELVGPGYVLYSLPSIDSTLPMMEPGSTKLGKRVLELHEDDWRQVELVSLTHKATIEAELRAIHRIHTEERQGYAFSEMHVREAIRTPLDGTPLLLTTLRGALGETAAWLEGVAFTRLPGVVAGGFAVKLPSGVTLYGVEHEGRVYFLGLQRGTATAAVAGDARLLAALASRHQLCLVDWCRVAGLGPSVENFQSWLSGET
jgi:hypothetical protein